MRNLHVFSSSLIILKAPKSLKRYRKRFSFNYFKSHQSNVWHCSKLTTFHFCSERWEDSIHNCKAWLVFPVTFHAASERSIQFILLIYFQLHLLKSSFLIPSAILSRSKVHRTYFVLNFLKLLLFGFQIAKVIWVAQHGVS